MKLILLLILLIPSFAQAAAIHDCGDLDRIENMVEKPKAFENGDVSVVYVSTEEPAAAADHVLILVAEPEMGSDCFAVSADANQLGFESVGFDKLTTSYDSNKGLLISFPVSVYDDSNGGSKAAGVVRVRINRQGGTNRAVIEN